MSDIISAFGSWIGALFSAQIAPGFSFGSFLLLMFILAGVGIILKTFWGGSEK